MAEETTIEPVEGVDPQTAAPETPPEPPKEPVAAAPEAPEPPKEDAQAQTPWFMKRINGQTAKIKELEEALARATGAREAAEALLSHANPETPPATPPAPKATPPEQVQTEAQRLAEQIVRRQQFDAACNTVFEAGTKEYGEKFTASIANLQAAGVVNPNDPSFLEAALATEAPHKLLQELGGKPEEAMRIAALPPTRMAIELDRMSRTLAAPPKTEVSAAPAPITPITPRGVSKGVDLYDTDSSSTAEWIAKRNADEAARRAARAGR